MFEIPAIFDSSGSTVPAFDLVVKLDGVNYILGFNWNRRAQAWFFDISDNNANPLVLGNVARASVLITVPDYLNGPPGVFFFGDGSGQNQDPGQFDLGVRVHIIYFTQAERAGLGL